MTVKIFGQLVDVIGSNAVQMSSTANTDDFIKKLEADYPALANHKYKIAVNKNIIQSTTALEEDAEIALLPPFSGG